MQQELISPAAYARLRGLHRSTISRQIRSGHIPTVGGLIDPQVADRAREHNLDPGRREQAQRRKEERAKRTRPRPAAKPVGGDNSHAILLETLRRICAPALTLRLAQVLQAAGLSAETAYAVALWYPCAVTGPIEEVTAEDLSDFAEPTLEEFSEVLGAVDFEAGDALFNEIAFADWQAWQADHPNPPDALDELMTAL